MRYQANGYCPWLCCLTEWHWRSHRHARGPRRALERNEVHQPVHECAPACLPHAQRACSSERMHAPQLLCVCAQGCGPCAHAALCSLSCAHAWSCIINSHCVVLVSEHAKHEVLRTHEAHFNARTRFAQVDHTFFIGLCQGTDRLHGGDARGNCLLELHSVQCQHATLSLVMRCCRLPMRHGDVRGSGGACHHSMHARGLGTCM